MRRVVVVSLVFVLIFLFGAGDVVYATGGWRVTGLLVPGSAAGAPYFPFNLPSTEWGLTVSEHIGGYAELMYKGGYRVGGVPWNCKNQVCECWQYAADYCWGEPLALYTGSPVMSDSQFYCDDLYGGCTGPLPSVTSETASGVFEAGTYLAWVRTGSGQKEVSSVYLDVIPSGIYKVDFSMPKHVETETEFRVTVTGTCLVSDDYACRSLLLRRAWIAWEGQTGWRQKAVVNDSYFDVTLDDYKIDESRRVGSGHLLILVEVQRFRWFTNQPGNEVTTLVYFMRDVWVGDWSVGSALSGGVLQMPEEGYVDVTYTGGWYPVGVPSYLGYSCEWTEKPAFLTARGQGNCEVSGVPTSEGFHRWSLVVTASNGDRADYSGKIVIRKFGDVVAKPGGTGLTSWIIVLTNTASTGIGSIAMNLDHVRVVFTNALKSLNVTVDDSLMTFDTSRITDFVAYGKGLLPPGSALPISAWIAVSGIDVALAFIGVVKGVIKWW